MHEAQALEFVSPARAFKQLLDPDNQGKHRTKLGECKAFDRRHYHSSWRWITGYCKKVCHQRI